MKLITTLAAPALVIWWHCGYWDGPLSGMCFYHGEACWFDCEDEDARPHRIYKVYRLTRWEYLRRRFSHWVFQVCVGYHTTQPHRRGGVVFQRLRWGPLSRFLFAAYYKAHGSKCSWRVLWR